MKKIDDGKDIEHLINEVNKEVESEIDNISRSMAVKYIPKLCEALRRENPEMKMAGIRMTVINRMSKVWSERTVRQFLPDWVKNPIQVNAQKDRRKKEKYVSSHSRQDLENL